MSRFMVILQVVASDLYRLSTARRASRFDRKKCPKAPYWTHADITLGCATLTQRSLKSRLQNAKFFCKIALPDFPFSPTKRREVVRTFRGWTTILLGERATRRRGCKVHRRPWTLLPSSLLFRLGRVDTGV